MVHPGDDTRRQRSLLVVAGSGRSGTSLITGLTGRLGMHIPKPEIKANESNPSGFGEPRWAVGFHKDLLKSVMVTHEDARPDAWNITARVAERAHIRARLRDWLEEQFEQSDRLVVKDPRLAWFLELYRVVTTELSVELSVVTMLRHPAEAVRSRQMAYTSKIEGTTRMSGWLNMMLAVEHATRELPRAIVKYDDLLSDWQATLSAAERLLPLELVSAASPEQQKSADALVDPTLRRATPDWAELHLPPQLRDLAQRTYTALCRVAVTPDGGAPSTDFEELDGLRSAFTSYYRDSELLARSSITAARAAERRRSEKRRKAQAAPARPQQHQPQPRGAESGATARPHAGLKQRVAALLRRGRG